MGELEAAIGDAEARGYVLVSRGVSTATLRREGEHRLPFRQVLALLAGLSLIGFGLWRAVWGFAVVGLAICLAAGADWWIQRRSMTIRMTVGDDGKVKKELLGVTGP
jgi:hypothetical protein